MLLDVNGARHRAARRALTKSTKKRRPKRQVLPNTNDDSNLDVAFDDAELGGEGGNAMFGYHATVAPSIFHFERSGAFV